MLSSESALRRDHGARTVGEDGDQWTHRVRRSGVRVAIHVKILRFAIFAPSEVAHMNFSSLFLPCQMTPAVLEQAGVNPHNQGAATAMGGTPNDALQRAFQQGVDYAHQQYEQAAADQETVARQQRVEALEEASIEQARALRERTEALQKREYRCEHLSPADFARSSSLPGARTPTSLLYVSLCRAPVTALACKEERQAALMCFRESKGMASGEVVLKCQQAADDLERCASLVREAAMSKIVAGSLDTRELS